LNPGTRRITYIQSCFVQSNTDKDQYNITYDETYNVPYPFKANI